MKTPDEIKKGLELHNTAGRCKECPYTADSEFKKTCFQLVAADALAYIQQIETRLAQVERERDAAVQTVHGLCLHCKNDRSEKCRKCLFWPSRVYFVSTETYVDHWEWRGVCPESTKEEK